MDISVYPQFDPSSELDYVLSQITFYESKLVYLRKQAAALRAARDEQAVLVRQAEMDEQQLDETVRDDFVVDESALPSQVPVDADEQVVEHAEHAELVEGLDDVDAPIDHDEQQSIAQEQQGALARVSADRSARAVTSDAPARSVGKGWGD